MERSWSNIDEALFCLTIETMLQEELLYFYRRTFERKRNGVREWCILKQSDSPHII